MGAKLASEAVLGGPRSEVDDPDSDANSPIRELGETLGLTMDPSGESRLRREKNRSPSLEAISQCTTEGTVDALDVLPESLSIGRVGDDQAEWCGRVELPHIAVDPLDLHPRSACILFTQEERLSVSVGSKDRDLRRPEASWRATRQPRST